MDDLGGPAYGGRDSDLPGAPAALAGRRPSSAQRRREAAIDQRLELAAAAGGFVLAIACAAGGASAALVAWPDSRFMPVIALGLVAAIGGSALALHFVATAAHVLGIGRPGTGDGDLTPPEAWIIALVIGAGGGAAVGIDVGALLLLVGGRTVWDLPPATVMLGAVVLPMVGLMPLAVAVAAAARRAWLRGPVRLALAAWVAGTVAGSIASGVWAQVPGV